MKRLIIGAIAASCALTGLPGIAAAQCEGGPTVAGRYGPNGVYIPGGCLYTNPTTPGQLYPSGAQPGVTTNPAAGLSALPGQRSLTGPLPVASTDLGPAPGYVAPLVGSPVVPGALVAPITGDPSHPAYTFTLPAAPPRETNVVQPPADSDDVVIAYPNH